MQWLNDLLENISISKSTTGAIFITSLVLLFGPRVIPEYIPATPTQWTPAVIAVMAFSGTLLAFRFASSTWSGGSQLAARVWKRAHQQPLSANELDIVLWLAKSPTIAADIEEHDFDSQPHTQLELIALINGLVDRGIVEYVALNNLVILTSEGCQLALELQRKARDEVSVQLKPLDVGTASNANSQS